MGGFDLADYDSTVAYVFVIILFLICTIFNMIVMLNLLIAIISESFANVNNNSKNAMYQEMSAIIAENNYLVPDRAKEDYAKKNIFLMVITDVEAVENESNDPVMQAVIDLQTYLKMSCCKSTIQLTMSRKRSCSNSLPPLRNLALLRRNS